MTVGYRVIVSGANIGFDQETVIATVARLFGKRPDDVRPYFDAPFVAKVYPTLEAAIRLERVLNLAGCRCTVQSEQAPTASTRPLAIQDRIAPALRAALHRVHRSLPHLRQLMLTPRYQRVACVSGALVALVALSVALPGHSALRARPQANAFADASLVPPAAPAAPDFLRPDRDTITLQREVADLVAAPQRTAYTPFGVITLVRAQDGSERTWYARWNGKTIREFFAETPPSLIAISDARTRKGVSATVGGEVLVVVDSGERTALCPASKVFLVVLPRNGIARTNDLQNDCSELESVTRKGDRLLFRFYDQSKSAVAFEGGRLVKLTRVDRTSRLVGR